LLPMLKVKYAKKCFVKNVDYNNP